MTGSILDIAEDRDENEEPGGGDPRNGFVVRVRQLLARADGSIVAALWCLQQCTRPANVGAGVLDHVMDSITELPVDLRDGRVVALSSLIGNYAITPKLAIAMGVKYTSVLSLSIAGTLARGYLLETHLSDDVWLGAFPGEGVTSVIRAATALLDAPENSSLKALLKQAVPREYEASEFPQIQFSSFKFLVLSKKSPAVFERNEDMRVIGREMDGIAKICRIFWALYSDEGSSHECDE